MATYLNAQPWRDQYASNSTQSAALGTWATTTAAFPTEVAGAVSIIIKGYLYVFQGVDSDGLDSNKIFRATLNASGVPGAFTLYGTVPGTVAYSFRSFAQGILLNNVIYIIGGIQGGGALSSVIKCTVNTDGSLGTWGNASAIPAHRTGHRIGVAPGKLYIIGGIQDSTAPVDIIFESVINSATGVPGAWTICPKTLPSPRSDGATITIGNQLYYLGGTDSTYNATNSIYVATVDAYGGMSEFTLYAVTLPRFLTQHEVVCTHSSLYLAGGLGGANVYRAPLSGMAIGSFTASASLPAVIGNASAVVTAGKLILLGGWVAEYESTSIFSVGFTGGYNDYTGFDIGSVAPSLNSTIAFAEEIDTIKCFASGDPIETLIDESADGLTTTFFNPKVFYIQVSEEEDGISSLVIGVPVAVISTDDGLECDEVAILAFTYPVAICNINEYRDDVSVSLVWGVTEASINIDESSDSFFGTLMSYPAGTISLFDRDDIFLITESQQFITGIINVIEPTDDTLLFCVVPNISVIAMNDVLDNLTLTGIIANTFNIITDDGIDYVAIRLSGGIETLRFNRVVTPNINLTPADNASVLQFSR